MADRIYLDHAATTPVLPAARAVMVAGLERWANPSSPHAEGRAARAALEDARGRIAHALGWRGAVVFTSGASEALALALVRARAATRAMSAVEHDAVRRAAPDAIVLPVSQAGAVDAGHVPEGGLVAIQHVNNETGVIQDAEAIASATRDRNALWLADCAQSAGKLALPEADLIAISAHKLGGPPGIGALLIRDPALLDSIGGQESGYRQGTENLPAILGFAAALEAGTTWLAEATRLRCRLEAGVIAAGGEVVCAGQPRIATIGAYRMPGVPAASQLIGFDIAGIAVSAGSACSSGSVKPSHVLAAMGWAEGRAREVIRVSFGPATCATDIDAFLSIWARIAGAAARAAA